MIKSDNILRTLVAPSVLQDLTEDGAEITSSKAVVRQFFAAVLFIDISDFTRMTEKFERLGPEGVEQLTSALNNFFGIMIDAITASGGEIDNLSGDALMAFWPASGDDEVQHRAATETALNCAANLGGQLAGSLLQDGTKLNVHSTLVAGPVERLYLGGHLGHRLTLLTGEPLEQISTLIDQAGPGELVFNQTVLALLNDRIEGDSLADGGYRLVSFDATNHSKKAPSVVEGGPSREDAVPHVHHFLQNGLLQRLTGGHLNWLAELRHLTVSFVALDHPDLHQLQDPEILQETALTMQAAVHKVGGAVQGLTLDDKGLVFFAVFGLPMLSHEDDTLRAITAMQSISEELKEQGYCTSIGVCSGMTYCGMLGTDDWRCYSVRGSVTNRAARLMSFMNGKIHVDSATHRRAKSRVVFDESRKVSLKGIEEPVDVWPVDSTAVKAVTAAPEYAILGRGTELGQIDGLLSAFQSDHQPQALVVEGAPGMGKTTLLDEAARRAEEQGLRVLRGNVDALDLGAVYAALRGVFQTLFEFEASDTERDKEVKISDRLAQEPDLLEKIPLLASVLQVPLSDNEFTLQMDGVSRADNTNSMLHHLLETVALKQPLVIVLDDCQWMDTASWKFIHELVEKGSDVLLILGARTERELSSEPIENLLERSNTSLLSVNELSRESISEMICAILNVGNAPDALIDFVHSRGHGNPYFSHELLQALKEQNYIEVRENKVSITDETLDFETIPFPDTIESVIVSRVDRLEPAVQFTLKIASVIGRQFPFDALFGVHPLRPKLDVFEQQLDKIEKRDFAPRVPDSLQLNYYFRHLLTHQTVYGLLAFSNRRELHGAVAHWIEENVDGARVTQKVALANHWSLAARPDIAVNYLQEAGDEALNGGAYKEAANFYDRAISAIKEMATPDEAVREARLYFGLGEIHTRLGDVELSYNNFCLGLEALGLRWPKTKFQLVRAILGAVARQAWHRIRKVKPDTNKPINERELVLANGMEKFGYLFFFEQRLNDLVLTTLHGLNFSEQANAPAVIRKTFAQMAVSLSIAKLNKWSNFYAKSVSEISLEGSTDYDLAFQLNYLALHAISQGQFEDADRYLHKGLDLAEKIGNRRLVLDLTSFIRSLRYLQSDYVQGGIDNNTYQDAVLASDDKQHQFFMRIALGEYALRISDLETAHRLFNEAHERLLPGFQMDRLQVISMRAIVEYRMGNISAAWQLADEVLQAIKGTPPIGYYAMDSYAGIAGLFLDYIEFDLTRPDFEIDVTRQELLKRAKHALKGLDSFSQSFPVSRPQYLLLAGRKNLIEGNVSKSISATEEALALAQEFGMAYDVAKCHYQFGQIADLDKGDRKTHLEKAVEVFTDIGLQREAEQASLSLSKLA